MTPENSIRPKFLTVAQLKRVLSDMQGDTVLTVNTVGNLAAYEASATQGVWNFVGYIDFLHEGSFEKA